MHSPIRCALVALALATTGLAQQPRDPAAGSTSSATGFTPPASLAPASAWSDDFNRPDGSTLGLSWVEQLGSRGIINNTGYGIAASTGWSQHATASIPYTDAVVSVDFLPKISGPNLVFVATMLGTGSGANNVFLKVQDNDSNGTYDIIWFYRGVHGAGGTWSTGSPSVAITPTVSGRMTCYITNNGDTANVDIDNNFDGIVDNHTERSGILAWGVNLGTGIGLGTYNNAAFDNWSAADNSGPAQPSTYCTAGTTSNGCIAVLSWSGTPSASATSGFTVTADDIEGQANGIFFYGTHGTVAVSWGVGSHSFLCVKTPLQRLSVQNAGGTYGQCDGTLAFDFLAFAAANPTALGQPLTAGQVFDTQAWFRDPPAAKSTNLSGGLEFTLVP